MNKVTVMENGNTKECVTKEEMEEALFVEGNRRFSQTNNEPPMEKCIIERMGFCAETEDAQAILDGQLDLDFVEDMCLKKLLKYMEKPDAVKKSDNDGSISFDEHVNAWQSQRSNTTLVKTQLDFKDHTAASFHLELADMDRLLRQIPCQKGFLRQLIKMSQIFKC